MKTIITGAFTLIVFLLGAQDARLMKTLDSLKKDHNAMIQFQTDSIRGSKAWKEFNKSPKSKQFNQDIKDRVAAILKIYDNYGFPGWDEAGKEGSKTFTNFVVHQLDLEFQERILSLMKADLDKGNASPEDYAKLYDAIYGAKNKKSYYGTYLVTTKDGRAKCCGRPLEDAKGVNERRAAIGLGTLEQAILDKEKEVRETQK